MYVFRDSTDHTSITPPLPSEAVSINGVYLENVIDGYRTLYVRGREALSPDIQRGEVGVRDGSYTRSKRFPARVLTIGYQIIASSNADFITAYQKLNEALNVEDAEIIFNDEQDKFLTGTPNGYAEIPYGTNSVVSEYEIVCDDPFKYSVTEYEAVPTEDSNTTIVVDYGGTYPAYPVLETNFYESSVQNNTDGDCGFVAFSTQDADVLQFGTVNEPDEVAVEVEKLVSGTVTTWDTQKCLVNEPFNNLTGWTTNDGYTELSTYVKVGTASVSTINSGSDKAVIASSYGATSNKQWHGCTVKKTLPSDGGNPATTGASDWLISGTMRFASNKTAKTGKKQKGMMTCHILDANGNPIAGFAMWKNNGTNDGTVRLFAGSNKIKDFTNVDFTHYNKRFGFKKKSKDKRPCNYDIKKVGNKLTFDIGGLTFSYKYDTDKIAKSISFYIAQWGSTPAMSFAGIYACKFTSLSVGNTYQSETWQTLTEMVDEVNTFTTNDVLICDTSDGTIRLLNAHATEEQDGCERPDLGALGNDWESFTLKKGTNYISTMYSDWVLQRPNFKIRYRERFL